LYCSAAEGAHDQPTCCPAIPYQSQSSSEHRIGSVGERITGKSNSFNYSHNLRLFLMIFVWYVNLLIRKRWIVVFLKENMVLFLQWKFIL